MVAFRQKREKLYTLMATMHAGPMGVHLAKAVKELAEELYGVETLPETPEQVPAELYRWAYGYCPGNEHLACKANSPADCLPAKFHKMAESAGKGAEQRRLHEATYIEDELLPCLETNLNHMEVEAYRELLALSSAILKVDADYIAKHPLET